MEQEVLAPVGGGTPSAFARAKLVELGMALLLVATVFTVVRRAFTPGGGGGGGVVLSVVGDISV